MHFGVELTRTLNQALKVFQQQSVDTQQLWQPLKTDRQATIRLKLWQNYVVLSFWDKVKLTVEDPPNKDFAITVIQL